MVLTQIPGQIGPHYMGRLVRLLARSGVILQKEQLGEQLQTELVLRRVLELVQVL